MNSNRSRAVYSRATSLGERNCRYVLAGIDFLSGILGTHAKCSLKVKASVEIFCYVH